MYEFDFVKSSYSNTSGECVEVALNVPGVVAVRDFQEARRRADTSRRAAGLGSVRGGVGVVPAQGRLHVSV